MRLRRTEIPEVLLIEPEVYSDERGLFFESYNKKSFAAAAGAQVEFVQDNHSRSRQGVLRGLHYQIEHAQGKLVRAVAGEIWDVALDLRRSSPSFGRWVGFGLSAEAKTAAWIPPGFAHGFLAVSPVAEVLYKTTDYYMPQFERTILWSDPALAIRWPLQAEPILAPKDTRGAPLAEAETYP